MPACSVCRLPVRDEVDDAIVSGRSHRDVAGQFSLSKSAVARHASVHLPETLTASQAARGALHADRLLEDLLGLEAAAWSLLEDAEEEGDRKSHLAAVREVRACLELRAKIAGAFNDATVSVNVGVAPVPEIIGTVEEYLALVDEVVEEGIRYRASTQPGSAGSAVVVGPAVERFPDVSPHAPDADQLVMPEAVRRSQHSSERAVRVAFAI